MTVAELVNELYKFDGKADVEVFVGTDNREIISVGFENYCLIGHMGQVVLMPKEFTPASQLEDFRNAIRDIASLAEEMGGIAESIAEICEGF